jgi:hypothetical protein
VEIVLEVVVVAAAIFAVLVLVAEPASYWTVGV